MSYFKFITTQSNRAASHVTAIQDAVSVPTCGTPQLEHTALGRSDILLVYGADHAGLRGFWIDGNGGLSAGFTLPTGTSQGLTALEMIETDGGDGHLRENR